MGREDQHHHPRGLDGIEDLNAVVVPGQDIARRDPASQVVSLEKLADLLGDRSVLARVADEHLAMTGGGRIRTPAQTLVHTHW